MIPVAKDGGETVDERVEGLHHRERVGHGDQGDLEAITVLLRDLELG